jgi:hypothetical protein
MSITLAVRGNSLDARYSSAGKTPGHFISSGAAALTTVSGAAAGVIGDSYIDLNVTTAGQGLIYPGGANLPAGQPFSVLIRAARKADVDMPVFSFHGLGNYGRVVLFRSTAGSLYFILFDDYGGTMIGQTSATAEMDLDVYHDIVMTCTGTTAANGLKIYRDGTLALQATLSGAGTTVPARKAVSLCLGADGTFPNTRMRVNEFVVWDSVIDPTSVALTSGTASLNGAARTAFVDVASFDATSSADPGVGNVRNATAYTIAGVAKTGTSVMPGAADVRSGTAFDTASTGSLDLPAVGNVKSGVTFDSATKTGTLLSTDPGVANVRVATAYTFESAAKVGTMQVSFATAEATVRSDGVASGELFITQGDTPTLTLIAKSDADTKINLTGATFDTMFLKNDGTTLTIANSAHTAAADQVTDKGEFTLVLTAAETAVLKIGTTLNFRTKITIGASILHVHGSGILKVLDDNVS